MDYKEKQTEEGIIYHVKPYYLCISAAADGWSGRSTDFQVNSCKHIDSNFLLPIAGQRGH